MDHKRYHLIQSRLDEARNALKVWNDRRAEVSIELDSIFLEIEDYKKQMASEKSDLENTVASLKASLEKSETDYHKHFEIYTNDMQEMKVANENLSNQLRDANAKIESLGREMKKQDSDHQARLAKVVSDAELKITEQQIQLKNQIVSLNAELQATIQDKNQAIAKATQHAKELRTIRGQMVAFLNLTKDVPVESGLSARIVTSDDSVQNEKNNQLDSNFHSLKQIDAHPPTTVNEYLKRFGYE